MCSHVGSQDKEVKPTHASSFIDSCHITYANITLAKTSHVAKTNINRVGGVLCLTQRQLWQSGWRYNSKAGSQLGIGKERCTFSHPGGLNHFYLFCTYDTTEFQAPSKSLSLTWDVGWAVSGPQLLHPQNGLGQARAWKTNDIWPFDKKQKIFIPCISITFLEKMIATDYTKFFFKFDLCLYCFMLRCGFLFWNLTWSMPAVVQVLKKSSKIIDYLI